MCLLLQNLFLVSSREVTPNQNATIYCQYHPGMNSHKSNGPFHSNNIAVEQISVQYFESKLLFSETTMEQTYKLLFTLVVMMGSTGSLRTLRLDSKSHLKFQKIVSL